MKEFFGSIKKFFNRKQFKYGGYAIVMTLALVVVIVVVNILITTLDTKFNLSLDLTANKVYSLTNQTKHILKELDEDVYIYTTFNKANQNDTIIELLDRYRTKSDFVHVENIDVTTNPGKVAYYEKEKGISLSPGSVIVSSSADTLDSTQSFKMLSIYDFFSYNQETEDYTLFTGEDAVSGAIEYVLNPNIPKVWFLEGHGTTNQDWYVMSLDLEDDNYDTEGISLLMEADRLEKGDILIIYAPSKDLSSEEREVLLDFALDGGKIMFILDSISARDIPNMMLVLAHYNISIDDGIVLEDINNLSNYMGYQNALVPKLNNYSITSPLISSQLSVISENSGAIVIGPDQYGIDIEVLMESSEDSHLEPLSDEMDFEKGENDKTGPFPLAVAITKEASDDQEEVKMIVTSSFQLFLNTRNMQTIGNSELFLNMVTWLNPSSDDFYIRGKSLQSSVLYFQTEGQVIFLVVLVCVLIPLLAFIAALIVYLKRRHL